jgi:phage/plasmid-like protein (TIGR03299 family)
MPANIETMAYREAGGLPWHGEGVPVDNDMSVDDMLVKSGLDWTVSKEPMYFRLPMAPGEKQKMRIVPDEFALIRDSDHKVLDTVGRGYTPVQNHDVFDFFKRFVEAGDMEMETAGSLKGGRFIWALAAIKGGSFSLPKGDKTNCYILLSQPHALGYALTACMTAVRVVCQNTLTSALGGSLDGSKKVGAFRHLHNRPFDDEVKAEAERTLGLAHEGIKAYSHTAKLLSNVKAHEDDVTDFFHGVLRLEHDEEVTEAEMLDFEENRNMKRLRESLLAAPGQELFRNTWWNAFNAVTYTVDHVIPTRGDNGRLFSAWYGDGAKMKRRALEMAVEFAKA